MRAHPYLSTEAIDMMEILSSTYEKRNKLRIAAILLILAVLFFVLFSVFFIVHEADHDCSGDDCPVCMLIQIYEDNIRQVGSGDAASATGILVFLALTMPVFMAFSVRTSTLISNKIRLNN